MAAANLTGQDIRTLRQQLGWSLAEMARQMGCSTELISKWEGGSSRPDIDALNQLQYLRAHVDNNSERTAQKPLAETHMEKRRLSQLTHRDLLKDN
jgi:transcriptional regulator with XRE-family HTH domain